ncbi:DHA2 family efflux MFS transporter permease subunit [Streptomyces sulphureus]|uniref:DHA2 family efflux MFS transporter permease subunit n=1 Tax=Streptomyces sulphureus TaxID=47758 RepID=UPI001319C6F2|nr:DHA2 family efflux MFS transporter permease subunit [Streptomyces sulphureus]
MVSDRRLNFTIAALGIGAIASILDSTIVNVGVDRLSTVFDASLTATQWVITGFLLAMTAIVPLSGWLIDRIGGRATWMSALGVFLGGSLLCGIAWDLTALISFRVLQGLGAGLIIPTLMTLLTQAAGQQRLMTAMGSFSLLVQVGPILGPVVGGVLLEGANWRWLFLVNIPFCVAGLVLAGMVLPLRQPSAHKRPLDGIGLALLTPALVGVVYALSNISNADDLGTAQVLLPLVCGLALLAGFIAWSLRDGASALIDVRLFAERGFAVSSGLSVLAGFTLFGGMLLFPLYFQQVRGASVVDTGLFLVPQGAGAAVLIIFGKKLLQRITARTRIVCGFGLMALGTVPFALSAMRDMTWLLIVALTVRGLGVGASTSAINASAVAGLPKDEIARGTTAFNIVQRIGAPFGTTTVAMILAQTSAQAAHDSAGMAGAFATTFWWTLGFTALPVALALLLPRVPAMEPERAA